MSNFSYEEIQKTTYEILSNTGWMRDLSQFGALLYKASELFKQRENKSLDREDEETLREIFSELFRSGIIIMGLDSSNPNFPFFKISKFGKNILKGGNPYFFHDVTSYEKVIREQVQDVDDLTMLYLKEAMQAFRSNCILSASVMLGVATEHTFLSLLETILNNTEVKETYRGVFEEKGLLRKFNKFQKVLEQNYKSFPQEIKEDIDTAFAGILSIIRTSRNESGHPTGKIISREQCYVLLSIYPNYCKKVYQMIDYFKTASIKKSSGNMEANK